MAERDDYRRLMDTEGAAVRANTAAFNEGRYESVAKLDDYEERKSEARATKEDAIERLPELVDCLEESVEDNGGTVYVAADATEANEYIRTEIGRASCRERVLRLV